MKSPPDSELPIEKLQSHLDRVGLRGLASPGDARVKSLNLYEKQGLSNKIYLLRVYLGGGSFETLILRLYASGNKAFREFALLELLRSKNIPVPRVYSFEEDKKVLGKPFIIMEKVEQSSPEGTRNLVESAACSLAKIHAVGPGELRNILDDRGDYPKRELDGIKILTTALIFSTVRPSASLVRYLKYTDNLRANLSNGRSFLLHGDYNFDNIVYSNGRAYVIDWESAEIAEPTFDVAYACNFLDFSERLEGEFGGKLSGMFLEAYERYGGTVKEFKLYRRLAALKVLLLLEVLGSKNLFSMLSGLYKVQRGFGLTQIIARLKNYLFEVLEGNRYL